MRNRISEHLRFLGTLRRLYNANTLEYYDKINGFPD